MIEAGGTATLTCRVTSRNQDVVDQNLLYRWSKEGNEDETLGDDKTLKIHPFKHEHEGNYVCRVTSYRSCQRWVSLDKVSRAYELKLKGE